jgi:hypothetical protein
MPAITLVRSGRRYTHEEWQALIASGEAETLLSRHGPGYTDEAWQRHQGPNNTKRKFKR